VARLAFVILKPLFSPAACLPQAGLPDWIFLSSVFLMAPVDPAGKGNGRG
jgi:hypothetical protein